MVSVVIPCYNGAKYLRETIQSALAQTHPPLEILVIDDGSTDDSAAIAELFGPPVRVIRQTNQGESVARNRGIDEAQGDWIAFLDADDLWLPEKLETQLAHQSTDSDFIVSAHIPIQSPEIDLDRIRNFTHKSIRLAEANFDVKAICKYGAPCLVQSVLVRKQVEIRFPVWTQYGEDTIYLLELAMRTKPVIVNDPLLVYRIGHAGQASNPMLPCLWHDSMTQWLHMNSDNFNNSVYQDLNRLNDYRLFNMALGCRLAYDRDRLDSIIQYVSKLPDYQFRSQLHKLQHRSQWYLIAQKYYRWLRSRYVRH